MKTVFSKSNGKEKCELRIHDRHHTILEILEFTFDTVNNWYPLNSEYDLVYHVEHDSVQVIPVSRKEILYTDYGIVDSDTKLEYSVKQGLDNVCIEPIKQDNLTICKLADTYGMPNWLSDFNYQEVEVGITQIDNKINLLTRKAIDNYYQSLDSEDRVKYVALAKDTRERLALTTLSVAEEEQYINYGKLYTMLNIMRKRAKVNA